jgi:hypothetical protein
MRLHTRLAVPTLILLATYAAAAHAAEPPISRHVSVLFLGDRVHHRPAPIAVAATVEGFE